MAWKACCSNMVPNWQLFKRQQIFILQHIHLFASWQKRDGWTLQHGLPIFGRKSGIDLFVIVAYRLSWLCQLGTFPKEQVPLKLAKKWKSPTQAFKKTIEEFEKFGPVQANGKGGVFQATGYQLEAASQEWLVYS